MGKTRVRRILAAIAAGAVLALTGAGYIATPEAHADGLNGPTSLGCNAQTVRWGFLWSQRRTLCDWPIQADGSWTRERIVWTPAHNVPFTCNTYGGSYYSRTSCSGGYFVDLTATSDETYPVTPETVLSDEPGWIAA